MKPLTGNVYFKTKVFDNQMVRTLGHCRFGALDFGECLAIAFEIEDGNWESWFEQWMKAADRIYLEAETSRVRGHQVSAQQGYFRAAEAYRSASFALLSRLGDPRDLPVADKLRTAFEKGAQLLPAPVSVIQIPYENRTLPGYFFRAAPDSGRRPTVIFNCGYHGFVEEVYFWGGASALARGYNVLAFDGPGQGQSLHRERTVFRPDWENVLTPVVDFALGLPEVDPAKLVLFGRSFGSCLAARAATAEHRFAAFIADPGEYDQFSNTITNFPPEAVAAFQAGKEEPMARHFQELFQNPDREFYFVSRMLAHGAKTPVDYLRMLKEYTVDGIADRITCPTLVTAASHDDRGTVQPQVFYDALRCPKTLIHFSAAHGAGDHCESGAPAVFAAQAFDWLDETLGHSDGPV